jgi:Ca2+-transporting ATPase
LLKTDFDLKSFPGLSESDAKERLEKEGYNELPSSKKRSVFDIAFEVVREPMFILLIAGGLIYLLLGFAISGRKFYCIEETACVAYREEV